MSRSRRVLTAAAILAVTVSAPAAVPRQALAHEIPPSVVAQVLVRADGDRLRVLVRVPLAAMRDYEFPARGAGGYFDFARSDSLLRNAAQQWIVNELAMVEDGQALPPGRLIDARTSLPGDRAFAGWGTATATFASPRLADTVDIDWRQLSLDAAIEYPITSATSRFSMRSGLARLGIRTTTVVQFIEADGTERMLSFTGDPGAVRLDPRWDQAAGHFVALGFRHILGGLDHLLFLLCLVLPVRRIRTLVLLATWFTVGHSITLAAAALGWAPSAGWFGPFIETLIAASIVWMAIENILGARGERRGIWAFGFGLVHGFGFAAFLGESLQFAGGHLALAMLGFNIGVELGQILALAVAVPILALLWRRVPERTGIIVISVIVAHTAWHWMAERGEALRAYPFVLPGLDAGTMASALRWLMALVAIAAVLWAVRQRPAGAAGADVADTGKGLVP